MVLGPKRLRTTALDELPLNWKEQLDGELNFDLSYCAIKRSCVRKIIDYKFFYPKTERNNSKKIFKVSY